MDISSVTRVEYNNQDLSVRLHSDTLPESLLLEKVLYITLKNVQIHRATAGTITVWEFKEPVYVHIQEGFFHQKRLNIKGKRS